jgi:hypothetical protein
MNDERKYRWPSILFFSMSGIVFGLSLYLIAAGALDSEARANSPSSAGAASAARIAPPEDEPRVRVVLRRDVRSQFGKVDVIYRGVEDDLVKLDVFIRDLDPAYPYRREIDYRTARNGFRMGGVRFELISAGRAKAKLVWHRRG